MEWALINNERCKATPNNIATCPLCREEVISKCGSIKRWHWSHKAEKDCDTFGEGETWWHINWKNNWDEKYQEIIIKKCISEYCYNSPSTTGGDGHAPCNHLNCVDCAFIEHRADIKNKNGIVIELQNSSINAEDIKQRESFYQNMIWLLNGNTFATGLNLRYKDKIITFRWKHPPKSIWGISKPIFIDMNKLGIFQVKKIYHNIPCGGWGVLLSKEEFLRRYG